MDTCFTEDGTIAKFRGRTAGHWWPDLEEEYHGPVERPYFNKVVGHETIGKKDILFCYAMVEGQDITVVLFENGWWEFRDQVKEKPRYALNLERTSLKDGKFRIAVTNTTSRSIREALIMTGPSGARSSLYTKVKVEHIDPGKTIYFEGDLSKDPNRGRPQEQKTVYVKVDDPYPHAF
jgi:hypothetical protein